MNQKPRVIKQWTKDEILFAAGMWNEMHTATEIAKYFGVTKDKINQLAFRHRQHFNQRTSVNTKNLAKLNLDVVLQFLDEGLSNKQIAEKFDVRSDSVAKFLKRNNIQRKVEKKMEQPPPEPEQPKEGFRPFFRVKNLFVPTPENTEIQYEFVEYDMPTNALNIPFACLEVGQCSWLDGGFWAESGPETNCCGLPVVDRRGKGLVKSYCAFHYQISIKKE